MKVTRSGRKSLARLRGTITGGTFRALRQVPPRSLMRIAVGPENWGYLRLSATDSQGVDATVKTLTDRQVPGHP